MSDITTTYDYTVPEYQDYTFTCPKCGRQAITTSFSPPIEHEVYLHVQTYNKTTDIWTLKDYCTLQKQQSPSLTYPADVAVPWFRG